MLLISCGPETIEKRSVEGQGYKQSFADASFILDQSINKKEITIAEQLELVLETAVPENMAVEFPTYSASLGDFTLKDSRALPARMTGSGDDLRVLHQIIYILEPYLSGTYTIPVMTVTYSEKENGAAVSKLVTREIQVPVRSLLPQDTDQVAIKDIKPPYSLPPDKVQLFLLAGLVLILAVLVLFGFYFWTKKRGKKISPEIKPGPAEIARQELERLLAENLLAKGKIKLFHLRISDILRHYIENRFGVRAPEQTTEEFLIKLSQADSADNILLGSHEALLVDFLSQCDLVKFAKHEPSMTECEKTMMICREFIEKTAKDIEHLKN
ncbi:MAG: hypothetical protein AMJ61_16505 [Desulfobacterales bacterium SG8_35_2]|nr:MAG: hypothetical protein AMJ61_16505 [Desulfobacterales bacterium SG8_35_2]